ncbi:hypothetical protein PMPD1_1311 [Paramixta manurensis]|uniref:Type III secretion translocon protein HrpF n=1 Tax=Paramixta manurensis TaxID=2740817 RepID=A0A6M8UHI6_9GAMM|nr:hypothetical protein PMPD1_1311 [Erwiniaceae bacterium PD-1]
MRLSGFSPSNFTGPRSADLPAKGAPITQQPEMKGAKSTPLSFMSSTPSNASSETLFPNKNAVIPQKNAPSDALSLGSLFRQMMSFVSGNQPASPANTATSDSAQPLPLTGSGQNDQMSFEEVVTTLGRHEDLLNKPHDRAGLEKIRDDPKTPTDAKKALDTLLKNSAMFDAIDPAKNGKSDGKISSKDIRKWQDNPAIKQYADAKAETYTHDYVPSDAKPGSPPRDMSANDAMRELYLYSESLPKNINLDTLRKVANGSQDMGKCPPQVAAAAKFFTDHPAQWKKFTGKDDPNASVSRDRMCDLASYNVKLSPQESKAIDTLKNNEDIFFKGGGINPKKLTQIANDKNNSPEVRDAANLLSQPNSMLFSMLDNGKHGAGGNFFNKANDHNIGKGDLDAFISKGSHQTAPPPRLAGPANDPISASAVEDMNVGQETQPDEKKEKGGGIFKLLDALSFLTVLIPGAGEIGLAANAGRAAITAAAKEGLKQGVKDGVKEGVKDGAHQAMDAAQNATAGNQQVNGPRVWAQS